MSSDLSEKTQGDAQRLVNIMYSMGVDKFSPQVVKQLLELQHRFTLDVLNEARAISEHAEKAAIDDADLRRAVRNHARYTQAGPPLRSEVQELAEQHNTRPLPPTVKMAV